MHPDDTPVFARACAHYPDLHVTVSKTPIGTYRVTFRDNEADAVIESRVFQKCVRAHEYAYTLINQA